MVSNDFISLHNHTHNSLLDGLSTDDEYLQRVQELGQLGFGVTDHGNVFGLYSFLKKVKQLDIIGIPGCEFYVAPQNPKGAFNKSSVFYGTEKQRRYDVSSRGAYLHLTVWAYNNIGLKNLFKLSSLSYSVDRYFQKPRIDFDLLEKYNEGLVISTGCPSSEISTRFLLGQDDKAYEYASQLKDVFGTDRMFVEIMNHNMKNTDIEKILLPKQLELSKKMGIELLATNDCHYAKEKDSIHHEEMLCIQSGSFMDEPTLNEINPKTGKSGRRFAFDGVDYYLKTTEQMYDLFPEQDFPRAITNTRKIAEMVDNVRIDFDNTLMPKPVIPEEFNDNEVEYYKHLIKEGLNKRYGDAPAEVKKRAAELSKKEFEVIHSSNFIGYMLVVTDYLQWTKDNYSTRDEHGKVVASSIGAGRGCFLPDNNITTIDGYKTIKDIHFEHQNGSYKNYVLDINGTYQKLENTFEYDVEKENCVKLTLSNGKVITCTHDHKIVKKDYGFVEASSISKNDILIGSQPIVLDESYKCSFCGSEKISRLATEKTYNEISLELGDDYEDGVEQYYAVLECNDCGGQSIASDYDDIVKKIEYIVEKVERFEYTGKVYDLHVNNFHNYTVSDITVHNSVGGSIHAFALGISEVDPIKHDLLFERFLSAGRGATYEIEYEDGTKEQIIVSDTKHVIDSDGNVVKKYIHELNVGDTIEG